MLNLNRRFFIASKTSLTFKLLSVEGMLFFLRPYATAIRGERMGYRYAHRNKRLLNILGEEKKLMTKYAIINIKFGNGEIRT